VQHTNRVFWRGRAGHIPGTSAPRKRVAFGRSDSPLNASRAGFADTLMAPFVFSTRIRFIDTDASGRIHYTAMFRYFESAEIEFLRSLGMSYDLRLSIAFPRAHVECDYRLALEHDDLIDIHVRVAKIGTSSVRFEFRTFKNDQVAADGAVVVVCMDRLTAKATALPPAMKQKLLTAMESF
jgi:acyl-CoA thioester hydrolase